MRKNSQHKKKHTRIFQKDGVKYVITFDSEFKQWRANYCVKRYMRDLPQINGVGGGSFGTNTLGELKNYVDVVQREIRIKKYGDEIEAKYGKQS